ncbi:hypothetical protein BT63DRAFT_451013 [Microthyrium microscopicum]|uniref:Chromatin assembly factor 1 subunit A n=1 Tax=Microthyrium microscopicum TaxID=703497 RepID=A0A6A6UL29_9PEZI|nr:hypothetical protein BT63DRAFT_451013 [Microthyrium microscopicum]
MAADTISPSSSLKRSAEDAISPMSPSKLIKLDQSPGSPHTPRSTQIDSPALTPLSALPSIASPMPGSTSTPGGSKSFGDASKKKKRSKEEIEQEKAAKEAKKAALQLEREEKKRKKEEEDRVKEEERAKKQAERDQKKAIKDAEKQAKEQEKQRKQEEQDKKDKASSAVAQLRMNTFFTAKPSLKDKIRTPNPEHPTNSTGSIASSSQPKPTYEFDATFLPFALKSNTQLAPINRFFDSSKGASTVISLEVCIAEDFNLKAFQHVNQESTEEVDLRQIFDVLHGTSENPIDLTSEAYGRAHAKALEDFQRVPVRYLHFVEDHRPPYCGTWSKPISTTEMNHLKRNPCEYKYQGLDYDEDSEAEWEEPEEGEDLHSDDDDESVEDEENLPDFVDDDVVDAIRPAFIRDIPPTCSGIQWEDDEGHLCPADPSYAKADFAELQMGCLLANFSGSIDPFSTKYWSADPTHASPKKKSVNGLAGPRPALLDKTRKMNSVIPAATSGGLYKVLRTVPTEDMDAFKAAIVGQDMTKTHMIEHLKKLFPKHSKDAITNTLGLIAKRESKKSDAKWHLIAVS